MDILISFLFGLGIGIPGCVFLGVCILLCGIGNRRYTDEDLEIRYREGLLEGQNQVLKKLNKEL